MHLHSGFGARFIGVYISGLYSRSTYSCNYRLIEANNARFIGFTRRGFEPYEFTFGIEKCQSATLSVLR